MNIVMILEVIVAALLIFVVLIQNKSVSLNLASMGWWMDSVVKRGSEKVLHNATIVLWILFILNSVLLYLFS